ncbi:unnamed protein product [Leptidea sinapis]|uniref:ATP synthase subunit n=1 Tax=Leptidea sinapis TaxID=189913 RepID=A0A5E4PX40_9NEOP|nr:unnamed protein product [Leptidea sinapis]
MVAGTRVLRLATNIFKTRNKFSIVEDVIEAYRSTLSNQKEKLTAMAKERINRGLKSELAQKIRVAKGYYTLEMAPPNINELQKLKDDLGLAIKFVKSGCFKHLTVKQAWLILMVCLEIGLWFFLGETIGKMHIVGYKV